MEMQVYKRLGFSNAQKATDDELFDVLSAELSYLCPKADALAELDRLLFSGRDSEHVQKHAPRFINLFTQGFFTTPEAIHKIAYLEALIDLGSGALAERQVANSPVALVYGKKSVDQLKDDEVLLTAAARRIHTDLLGSVQIGYLKSPLLNLEGAD